MDIKQAIAKAIDRHDLSGEEMTAVMQAIMGGLPIISFWILRRAIQRSRLAAASVMARPKTAI